MKSKVLKSSSGVLIEFREAEFRMASSRIARVTSGFVKRRRRKRRRAVFIWISFVREDIPWELIDIGVILVIFAPFLASRGGRGPQFSVGIF